MLVSPEWIVPLEIEAPEPVVALEATEGGGEVGGGGGVVVGGAVLVVGAGGWGVVGGRGALGHLHLLNLCLGGVHGVLQHLRQHLRQHLGLVHGGVGGGHDLRGSNEGRMEDYRVTWKCIIS